MRNLRGRMYDASSRRCNQEVISMWYKEAKEKMELPVFDPSPAWERLANSGGRVVTASSAEVEGYEEALGEMSDFSGDPLSLFSERNPGQNMMGFDSLYVGPSGKLFLIRRHSHDETAGNLMRKMHPEVVPPGKRESKGRGWSHHHLALASGIQRMQIYRDGMGVTIDMNRPPNRTQLNTIRETFKFTPMEKFVAEITLNGKLIAHLTSFQDLVHFVHEWDPESPENVVAIDPRLSALFH